ncbi:MAG: stage II sporulation protein M [Bacilli bacterium]
MKKQMDKLKNKTISNKKIIVFLVGLFLIGLIAGSIFITIISKSDQALVKEYIKEFVNKADKNKLNYLEALKNASLSNGLFIVIVWLLGFSIIGIPIVIFMYFSKAFILGFSLSSFILQYKFKGLLLALIYFFPHHVVNILAYTLIMIYSLKISFILINSIIKKKTISFKAIMNRYLIVFAVSIGMVIVASLYECFVVPFLIRNLIGFL